MKLIRPALAALALISISTPALAQIGLPDRTRIVQTPKGAPSYMRTINSPQCQQFLLDVKERPNAIYLSPLIVDGCQKALREYARDNR